jgi:hypothetical protein
MPSAFCRMATLADQTSLPWPDEFPRKTRRDGDAQAPSAGHVTRDAAGYSTETDTTPEPIIPSARAAVTDTSMILPRINGPRSLTRHCIERPDHVVTVTTLPIGLVR